MQPQSPPAALAAVVTPENDDPFGVFATSTNTPNSRGREQGYSMRSGSASDLSSHRRTSEGVAAGAHSSSDLPSGGKFYQVDVYDDYLGMALYKAGDLMSSILAHHDPALVSAIGLSRPVVAHLTELSPCAEGGIEVGHVLVAVNDQPAHDREAANRLIRSASRPVTLRMYSPPGVPSTRYEGEVWVHYKSKDTEPPSSTKHWKSKYVVVGGIISRPYEINMFKCKGDYDMAVSQVHKRQPVSVKVKQFSLEGATLSATKSQQGWEMLQYPNEMEPRQYVKITMAYPANPVKMSLPSNQKQELRSVLNGVIRGLEMMSRQ